MISDRVCDRLIAAGLIPAEQKALYRYGLSQLLLMLLNVATAALIGLALGMLWQSLLFLAVYIPLRRFAGGIHASTPLRCYVSSVFLIIFILLLIATLPAKALFIAVLSVFGGIALWFLAPVEDPNKPFTAAEERHFRRVCRKILLAEVLLSLILCVSGLCEAALCVVLALWTLVVMDGLGKVKNHHLKAKAVKAAPKKK